MDYATLKGTGAAPVYVVILGQYWNGSTSSCSIGVAVSRVVASNASASTFVSNEVIVGKEHVSETNYDWKQFFVNSPIAYPEAYAGEVVAAQPPPAEAVFTGDSFISGHGNSPYEAGTDNECKRSIAAFPRLLQITLDLGPTAFVACSGATTANVLYGGSGEGAWNESPQVDALSEDTENVVTSIGGNNVGFKEYGIACAITLCGPGSFDYNYIMAAINDSEFFDSLVATYETILEEAPNAEVYVVDYPYLATETSETCGLLDLTGAWAVQNQLNAVIHDAVVEGVNNSRLHYVPTNYTGSPFTGHHLCTTESGGSYFDPGNLHPNVAGHQAYAEVLEDAMS